MTLVVHGYTEYGLIDITIDGERKSVPDQAENLDRKIIAAWEEEGNSIPEYVPVTPVKTRIYKSTFVERCTEEELTLLRDHLATENIKFQEMYAACDYFLISDPMFAVLYWTVSNLLTPARADELLEMEE